MWVKNSQAGIRLQLELWWKLGIEQPEYVMSAPPPAIRNE
jgi:hypothetical protein